MPVETEADRAVFVDPDDFGAVVEWPEGSGVFVNAIFDDTFAALTAGDLEFEQSGSRLSLMMRSSDVPANAAHEDEIAVGTALAGNALVDPRPFKVLQLQPDGTGMTTVRLEEIEEP